nr:phosphodiesterase [uncultured Acidaminococcus sp.]
MKWLIASDIHGSALFTRQLLERFRAEGADRLLLLGDLLYHGPRNDLPEGYAPKEVIRLLNSVKDRIFCVRGNCEAEVDQMVLEFPVLAEYALLEWNGHLIFATHGHLQHPEPAAPPARRHPAPRPYPHPR